MLGLMGKLYDRRRIILNLFKGILDKFSGAVAGYSLRRLSKWKIQLPSEIVTPLLALSLRYVVVGYTGAVVRVRRSSDNAELDFNPTEITDGTLTTWTGSGDGFVTKIYDQSSGGDDMVQATASLQGIIVDAGVLNTEGGKPIIHRSASNDGGYLSTFQPNDGATVKGMFYVGDNNGKSSDILGSATGGPDYGFFAVSGSTETIIDNNPTVTASIINGASNTPANRGVAYTATDLQFLMYREIQFNFDDNVLGLGYRQSSPVGFGMFSFQELIICDTDGKGGEMEFNINAYYDIYEQWDGESVAKVRRSSDNAELDFKANEITDGTLTTWTGSADGLVTKWYDQSGSGNDAIQTTASKQPMIVDAGVLVTDNGKPALKYDGEDDGFTTQMPFSYNGYSFMVTNVLSSSFPIYLGSTESNNRYFILNNIVQRLYQYYDGSVILNSSSNTIFGNQYLHYGEKNHESNTNLIFQNNVSIATSSITTANPGEGNIQIGFENNGDFAFEGTMQEIILYRTRQNVTRPDIQEDINNHYSIY